jgi:hypothetical protein
MVELRERRLAAAFCGFLSWLIMYNAITVTRLIEVNAVFWPRFVVFGVLLVGLCAWRGGELTAHMLVHMLGYWVAAVLFIWFFWPYLPLSDILPVPEARWELVDPVPAPDYVSFYILLCYMVALPLAVVTVFFPLSGLIIAAIGATIITLHSAIVVYQFFTSQ